MVLPAAAVDGVHLPAECPPVAAVTAVRPVADGHLPVVLPAECRPVAAVTAVLPVAGGSLPVVLPAECRPVAAVMAVLPVAAATAVRPAADGSLPVDPPAECRPVAVVTVVRPAVDGSLPVARLPAVYRPVVMALRPVVTVARRATDHHPAVSVAASLLLPEESRLNSLVARPRKLPR